MSRIRTIKPEWRTDQKLARAGLEARVLSVALITLADDEGRGVWREPVMAVEVFGFDANPSRLLREGLARLSGWFLEVYRVRGEDYFQIVNWSTHQKVDKKTASRIPPMSERDPDPEPSGGVTPESPTNTPIRESLASESREPREDVASDSAVPRESFAPGPRTVDHGPRTVDRGASRAPDPGPLAAREALLARLHARLHAGWGRRFAERTATPSPPAHHTALRPVATWCAEWLSTRPDEDPDALVDRLLAGFFGGRADLARPKPEYLAEDPGRYVTGTDARPKPAPKRRTDRLPPGTGAGFSDDDIPADLPPREVRYG